jgi:predicted porin
MKSQRIAYRVIVAFAVCTTALAQGTNVTLYGTLNVDFERVEAKDTSRSGPGNNFVGAPSALSPELDACNRVSSNASNIGLRGTEELGNGLKAIFQCESTAAIDGGTAGLCTRNSHVCLSGAWGTSTPTRCTTRNYLTLVTR